MSPAECLVDEESGDGRRRTQSEVVVGGMSSPEKGASRRSNPARSPRGRVVAPEEIAMLCAGQLPSRHSFAASPEPSFATSVSAIESHCDEP